MRSRTAIALLESGLVLRQAQDEALRAVLEFLMLSLSKYEGGTIGRQLSVTGC